MDKAYYCETCHSVTEYVPPEHHPDQERKYLEMMDKHRKNPTTSYLALQFQFLYEKAEHWNYTMTCPVCGGVHRYWQGEEKDG